MMEKEITMRLNEERKNSTVLGWKTLTIVDFGYDARGDVQTAIIISGGREPMLFNITEPEITEDLMMNYSVVKGE